VRVLDARAGLIHELAELALTFLQPGLQNFGDLLCRAARRLGGVAVRIGL
jgi:hypothetical protein